MENKKYVVCRDNIYVGEVVKAHSIYRYNGEDVFYKAKIGQLSVSSWRSYRSILFVPDENKLANDLLYRTPSYPILNITDDDTCLNLEEDSIVIKDACNLSEFLECFGYKKDLTYKDIMRIRKTFFRSGFAKDNCELFGYKETMAEDVTFYTNGKVVTDPKELKYRRKQFRLEQQNGHRLFTSIGSSPIPREYWDVLNDRCDKTFMEVLVYLDEKMNAFTPHEQEGPVKRLKRF